MYFCARHHACNTMAITPRGHPLNLEATVHISSLPCATWKLPTMQCVICFDDVTGGGDDGGGGNGAGGRGGGSTNLCCAANHAVCGDCCDKYVQEKIASLRSTDLLAAKADAAEATEDTRLAQRLAGRVACPLQNYGCEAPPFEEKSLCMALTPDVFSDYVQAKTLLPAARKVQQVLLQRNELTLMLPGAKQCGRCAYGPIMLAGCTDLASHHGQVRAGSSVPIDNSCPRCSWFRPEARMWPAWEPNALGTEDANAAAFEGLWAVERPRAERDRALQEERERWMRAQREERLAVRAEREQAVMERRRERAARDVHAVMERRRERDRERQERDLQRQERDLPEQRDARERRDEMRDAMRRRDLDALRALEGVPTHELEEHLAQALADHELPPLLPPLFVDHEIAPPPPAPPPPPPPPPPRVAPGAGEHVRRAAAAAAAAAAARAPIEGLEADLISAAEEPQREEPHASRRERKQRKLALFSRLTGLDANSQATAMYLEDAGGDVEAAIRAAVQGVCGYASAPPTAPESHEAGTSAEGSQAMHISSFEEVWGYADGRGPSSS